MIIKTMDREIREVFLAMIMKARERSETGFCQLRMNMYYYTYLTVHNAQVFIEGVVVWMGKAVLKQIKLLIACGKFFFFNSPLRGQLLVTILIVSSNSFFFFF